MDENYLDNLLNEISLDKEIDHNVEDELDDQLHREKMERKELTSPSQNDKFDMDLEQDALNSNLDPDVHFSEKQMDELDNLDDLADLDIGDLDFSDIDFDDVDVTKLDEVQDDQDLDALLKEFDGDLEIADYFDEDKKEEKAEQKPEQESDARTETGETESESNAGQVIPDIDTSSKEDSQPDTEVFNADQFLDGLLNEEELDQADQSPIVDLDVNGKQEGSVEEVTPEVPLDFIEDETKTSEMVSPDSEKETADADDLDDLFSLLDLEENGTEAASPLQNEAEAPQDSSEQPKDSEDDMAALLDDIEELPEKKEKKKKSFMTILFGEPDEDDELSQEELEAIEVAKAEKKAKKAAAKKEKEEKKAAAKAEKEAKAGEKKKSQEEKKKIRAVKKAERKQEEEKNAEPEKPLNRPAVIFIFTLFLGGTFMFCLATNNFNYTVAIEKATKYFENQKYHSAYDEIKGVEVKEKDQELKDRIYTVMYVERLYESYQNNLELGRQKKALDSLLRGVDKYYEYYEEAQQLGIVSDLDYSFAQIQSALQDNYGITVEQAVAMNQMESYEYVQAIDQYVTEQEVVR